MTELKVVHEDPRYVPPQNAVDIDELILQVKSGKNLNRICVDENWPEDEVRVYLKTLIPKNRRTRL